MKLELNTIYNALDKNVISKAKEALLTSPDGKSSIDSLNKKIESIIYGKESINENTFTNQMSTLIKNDILNAISGYVYDIDKILPSEVTEFSTSIITDFIQKSSDIESAIEEQYPDANYTEKIKQAVLDTVNEKLKDAISKLDANSILCISSNLYSMDNPLFHNAQNVVSTFLNDIYGNAIQSITNSISSYIEDGLVIGGETLSKDQIVSKLTEDMSSCIDDLQTSATSKIESLITNGVDDIVNRLNQNIQGVFCQSNEIIQTIEQVIPISQMISDTTNKISTGFKDTISGVINGQKNTPNNSKEKIGTIKEDVKKTNKSKEEAAKTKETTSNPQPSSPEPTQTKQPDKNTSSKKSTNVEDRKESSNKKEKDKDPGEPKLETYDNSKPPEASRQDDPRRAAQELVLWEGTGSHYVLLRDKPGNYICFDEGSNNIRLQHVCGSFIELRASGDIIIQAKSNVLINGGGSDYIKKT